MLHHLHQSCDLPGHLFLSLLGSLVNVYWLQNPHLHSGLWKLRHMAGREKLFCWSVKRSPSFPISSVPVVHPSCLYCKPSQGKLGFGSQAITEAEISVFCYSCWCWRRNTLSLTNRPSSSAGSFIAASTKVGEQYHLRQGGPQEPKPLGTLAKVKVGWVQLCQVHVQQPSAYWGTPALPALPKLSGCNNSRAHFC